MAQTAAAKPASAERPSLTLTRRFRARPEKVWSAWTDPDSWAAYDAVVVRGHGSAVLGAAYAAEACGVLVLNAPRAVAAAAQRPSISGGELRVHGIGGQLVTLRRSADVGGSRSSTSP